MVTHGKVNHIEFVCIAKVKYANGIKWTYKDELKDSNIATQMLLYAYKMVYYWYENLSFRFTCLGATYSTAN